MSEAGPKFSMLDPGSQNERDKEYASGLGAYWPRAIGSDVDKLRNFSKFAPRQVLAQFMARERIFEHVLHVHGHIVECGVFLGGGVMTWAQLSAIHEPYNHVRRIVGFDTFAGFPVIHAKDATSTPMSYLAPGGLAAPVQDDLGECLRLYDINRPLGHIPRVELVAGDAAQTIPEYVASNAHVVVALLYLDFDLYEPTKAALETFLPRMPKGAVIAFDELDQSAWPGETLAVLATVGLRNLRIRRFPFMPQVSYAVLE